MEFSKLIVILLIISIYVYTGIALWIFYSTGIEPTTLTACFFAAMVGEFTILGMIKKAKEKGAKGSEGRAAGYMDKIKK